MAKITPPWTAAQVAALNRWQNNDRVHGFTCGNDRGDAAHVAYAAAHGGDLGQLVATPNGWFCPVCDYTQKWAHDFMAAPTKVHGIYDGWRGITQPCDVCGQPVAVNAVSPSECFCSQACGETLYGLDQDEAADE